MTSFLMSHITPAYNALLRVDAVQGMHLIFWEPQDLSDSDKCWAIHFFGVLQPEPLPRVLVTVVTPCLRFLYNKRQKKNYWISRAKLSILEVPEFRPEATANLADI